MERLASVIRKELIHDMKAVSGGISPEDSAESFNRLGALPIVSAVGDIGYVRAQLVNNLIGILKLLWREIGVIENPVILFSEFVFVTKNFHG